MLENGATAEQVELSTWRWILIPMMGRGLDTVGRRCPDVPNGVHAPAPASPEVIRQLELGRYLLLAGREVREKVAHQLVAALGPLLPDLWGCRLRTPFPPGELAFIAMSLREVLWPMERDRIPAAAHGEPAEHKPTPGSSGRGTAPKPSYQRGIGP